MAREPKYTDEQVRSAVEGAHSLAEAIRNLGLRPAGANHRSIRKLIAHYGISTVHFDPNWASRRGNHARREIPLDRVLVERSTYGRGHLKRRLYETGLKQRRCEMCGQNELWNGQMMSLILDHINGVADDNRLENCGSCVRTVPRPWRHIAGARTVSTCRRGLACTAVDRSFRSTAPSATARTPAACTARVRGTLSRAGAKSTVQRLTSCGRTWPP
jgi:hypothetical protein